MSGTVIVEPLAAGTITRTQVSASLASVTLLAANTARRGAVIRNGDPAARLYVSLGAAAATTVNAVYDLAPGASIPIPDQHTYEVRGIWAGAAVTGQASMAEVT